MRQQFIAGLFFALIGAAVGYLLATEYLRWELGSFVGYDYFLFNMKGLYERSNDTFVITASLMGILTGGGALFGAHFAAEALTRIGTSTWQSARDLRRNNLVDKPGHGFVLAKTSKPKRRGRYIGSDDYPNCLVIAPTGAGKGVGFVYPNLLTFQGSTVTLDIKGENYETTARQREALGDKVYKFAPVAFGKPSHRYNPLERIGKLDSYSEIIYELRKIATLFLQAPNAGEFIAGAVQLFVAAGAVAHERGTFTLGGIHRVLAEGDSNIKKHLESLMSETRNPELQLELGSLAKLDQKTLSAYQSVMSNAGFDLWSNPHIAAMTSKSDFSFKTLRRERASIYFQVPDTDLETIAGLVRLFFNELVGTIQTSLPERDEPHHVMIILDEFHRLGTMEKVADAMSTIRGFNGRIAIITQLLPKLDKIYGYEGRLAIQGNAPLKLYLTPAEEMTVKDVSEACGMTTKRTITKSRTAGLGNRATITERTEERPLLTEDDARRLDEDRAIVIVKGRQPVKAWRIKHYEDPTFTRILAEQEKRGWGSIDSNLLTARVSNLEAANPNASSTESNGRVGPTPKQLHEYTRERDKILAKSREDLSVEDLEQLDNLVRKVFGIIETAKKLPPAKGRVPYSVKTTVQREAADPSDPSPEVPARDQTATEVGDERGGDLGSSEPVAVELTTTGAIESASDVADAEADPTPTEAAAMARPKRRRRAKSALEEGRADQLKKAADAQSKVAAE